MFKNCYVLRLTHFRLIFNNLASTRKLFMSSYPWLLGYLLFSIVWPWATFVYLWSQKSSLMGCPYKNCPNFPKCDVSLVFISFLLASFVFRNYCCHQTLGYWLPILSYCLTMGYIWLPFVIYQM